MAPVGEHRHHRIDPLDRLAHRSKRLRTVVAGTRRGFVGQVEGAHLVSRPDQIRGHPAAHVAEADEGNFHVSVLSSYQAAFR